MSDSPTPDDLIIGIDLGTTHSLVGVVDSGFPIILADPEGRRLLPSVVHESADQPALVGEPAVRMAVLHPDRTHASVKRWIGETSEAEARSAAILQQLKTTAEAALEHPVSRAVITVPAYFNDAQRSATKRAGELAGLEVVRILNEPTAAALAYGLDKLDEKSTIAVYDLGGGTFDLSILQMQDGVFQVLSTNGDTRLGGDDIDRALVDHLSDLLEVEDACSPEQEEKLRAAARAAKEALSTTDHFVVRLPFFDAAGSSHEIDITRDTLEELARPILNRTREICLRALSDANLEAAALDRVILVGGTTRMPLVQEIAGNIFGKAPDTSQHPDETIALGAAIQAGILCGRVQQVLLLDVTPLSLGIETFGGLMNVIIPRNTTIPAKAGELFTNAIANQRAVDIRILQGEREMAKDNWELSRIEIPFPSGDLPKGSARIGVQFTIDENGILTVLSRDTHAENSTDHVLEITHAAVDVDDERVEAMVSESIDYAFEDMNERIWTEAKLKSEELLPAVDQALLAAGDALNAAERETIRSSAEEVRRLLSIESHDATALKAANLTLDLATEALAAILVERAMDRALGG